MFWDRLIALCAKKNISPNAMCSKIGLSNAIATKWKKGSVPHGTTLEKIANFFDVSTDYLLGKTEIKAPADNGEGFDKNTIKIAGRDGSYVERNLTDEQLDLIKKMINQLPNADNL